MPRNCVRGQLYAGTLFCSVLLAFTPTSTSAFAQQTRSSLEPQQSLISVAPAARPEAESLARRAGDATFQNAPANYHVFAAATVGEDAGVERIALNFAGETRLTRLESKSKDFVIEPGGTCREGNSYSKGDSCTLLVRFDPQGPGHRLGHLEISSSAEAAPMYVGLVGNGYAPVVSFTPAQITTVPSTASGGTGAINGATNMAVDGGDILYIADTGNNKVREIDSSGILTSTPFSPISTPASLAADNYGILYTANTHGSTYYFSVFYPWGSQTAYGYPYTYSTCTVSAPCALSAVGMSYPANMSIDAYDDLFFEEGSGGAAEMPVSSIAGGSGVLNLWHLSDQFAYSSGSPASFAADPNGNIYTKYNFGSYTCELLEESLYNAEYSPTANRVAGGVGCGFSGDGGQARGAEISSTIGQMAFDAAGNLYFADEGNQRVRRIDYNTGIIRTIAGNGTAGYSGDSGPATAATLSSPTGVAVDSQGQVYILSNVPTAGPTQALRKVGQTGYLNFGSQANSSVSAANTVLVSNTGNSTMTLTDMQINGPNASEFTVDPNTTTCNLTANADLDSGQSCQIGILFSPKVVAARTANLVLVDNTINGTDTVILSGAGVLSTAVLKIASPILGHTYASGSSITFTATVTGVTGVPAPTGTVKFGVDGVVQGSPVTLSSGSATITVNGLLAGSHSLTVTYSGDTNYAAGGPTGGSIIISAPALVPTQVTLERTSAKAQSCTSAAFAVKVTGKSAAMPTGTVRLFNGKTMIASGSLVEGKVTLKATLRAGSEVSLVAHYLGDKRHKASQSETLKVTTTDTVPCEVQ